MCPPDPLLSIVIPARNDQFMVNFGYRLETTLNYMASNLALLGVLEQVEVVLADWGSSIPLFRELSLSEHARKIVRHLIIPPQVAAVVQRDSEFPIVLAQNAALRRCRGQYLMQTDSDVLFPIEFLESFFELVLQRQSTVIVDPAKALIGVKRRHIPVQFTFSNPPVSELERFIREHPTACNLEVPEQFPFCATGMMVMHRDLWSEFRGYDERLIYWGWMEIDLGLRTSVKYPYYDLTDVHGMVLFHLEHYVDNGQGREVERKMNTMDRPNQLTPNPEDWGLAQYDLPVLTYPDYGSIQTEALVAQKVVSTQVLK